MHSTTQQDQSKLQSKSGTAISAGREGRNKAQEESPSSTASFLHDRKPRKRTARRSILHVLALVVALVLSLVSTPAFAATTPTASYRTHVQNVGWQSWKKNGQMAGTTGRSLRLEAINIKLSGVSGGVVYRTHVQNIGWQGWKSNGVASGTSGRSLRLEAIQIKLSGAASKNYDVYYRVHCQNVGWMGWAKNGASAGSEGYAYRLEGIEIRLVKKGGRAPGTTAKPFIKKTVRAAQAASASKGAAAPASSDAKYYRNVSDAYTIFNNFRTSPSNQWYWNPDNRTKTTTYGLRALSRDTSLENTAKLRAKEAWEMYYVRNQLTHTRPNGQDCFSVYPAFLYKGENLGWGHTSSREIICGADWGWAETNLYYSGQGHRRLMLSSNFSKVGIACYEKNGKTAWAMALGG